MDSEPLLATGSPFLPPILNFQQPFHVFCTDSLFFATNPQQCCNNCSNSCFLSDYSTTLWCEGRPFREPSGLSIAPPWSCFSFGATFLGLIFRSLFFYKKYILGAKRCFKIAPKLTREATSEVIFTFFKEPRFWTTLLWFWRIFKVPLTMKYTKRHQKSECETTWQKTPRKYSLLGKMFKSWLQNDSQNVTWWRGKSQWAAQGGPFSFLSGKSVPHVLQKWSQRTKIVSKGVPNSHKSGGRGLADCAKRLQLIYRDN